MCGVHRHSLSPLEAVIFHSRPKEGLSTLTTAELCLRASEQVPRGHTRSILLYL